MESHELTFSEFFSYMFVNDMYMRYASSAEMMDADKFNKYVNDKDFNQNMFFLISKLMLNVPSELTNSVYDRFELMGELRNNGNSGKINHNYQDED